MNYEVKKLEKSAVEVKLHLTAEEVKPIVDKVLAHVGEHAEIAGFRKGHAPKEALMANYKDHIESDVANDAINANFPEIVDKEKLEPVSYVRLKEINLKDDLDLTFDIDVYPQFELGNYKGLEAEKKSFEMTDDILNKELEIMVRNHAKLEEVEDAGYKAQLDDTVDLAFEGFMDGVPFPGGKAESHLLKLGSKSFIDNFEEQLVGYTKGQEGEITVKFPDEYHAPELAGKPAQFKVKINTIKKLKQPELNDEFAKELGYASLDELKAKTKEEIIKRENDRIENEYVSALLDKLMETTAIDVPVSMVQAEIQNRLKELEYQLSMQGFKMDDYLKMMGGNVDTFAAQLAPAAEKKVKIDLILDRIAKNNNFEASDEELNQRVEEVAKMYGMDVPALEEELKKNKNLENFKASLKYDIVMKKAIDEVVKNSKYGELNPPSELLDEFKENMCVDTKELFDENK
ncbi:trigger factor [Fusobacterium simiae]|uniref:trigger factor n=1 Tax=Fusobacterium TaxID=848 RepID=UPI00041DE159|nr:MULTISPECIES: trigger factor [Fusobacterium]MDC7954731.1 trigger factor [Fusobacterium simiae]